MTSEYRTEPSHAGFNPALMGGSPRLINIAQGSPMGCLSGLKLVFKWVKVRMRGSYRSAINICVVFIYVLYASHYYIA